MACQRGRCFGNLKAKSGQFCPDRGALPCADVAKQEVLVCGETDFQLVGLDNATQAGLAVTVQASAEQGKTDEPEARPLAMPAEVIEEFWLRLIAQALELSFEVAVAQGLACLLYTSPSPRDQRGSRMPSSA